MNPPASTTRGREVAHAQARQRTDGEDVRGVPGGQHAVGVRAAH